MKAITSDVVKGKVRGKMHPREVLDDFFEWYSFESTKEELWDWLLNVMCCTDLTAYNKPAKRTELFFFYEKLRGLIEAAHAIRQDSSYPGSGYA